MYVCICNAVTDRDLRAAVQAGVRSFADVRASTGCSDCCGSCEDVARTVFEDAVAAHARPLGLPVFAQAA